MTNYQEGLLTISHSFKACQKILTAIGDETRQQIILALLESDCRGIRVGEITEKTHLSRPAVSHHIQLLKEANLIGMRREGTKNYYYMDASGTEWRKILLLSQQVNDMIDSSTCHQEDDL